MSASCATPEQRELLVARQTGHGVGQIEAHFDAAALVEAVGQPAKRAQQTQLVQQRRMKQIRRRADFVRTLTGQLRALLEQLAPVAGDRRCLHQSRETQFQGRERLAGGVVKVAADAPAFVVLQAHELAGGPAEIGERLLALERRSRRRGGAVVTQQCGHHDEQQARRAGHHQRSATMIPPRLERGVARLAGEDRHVVAMHALVAIEHVRAHGLPEAFHHAGFGMLHRAAEQLVLGNALAGRELRGDILRQHREHRAVAGDEADHFHVATERG